MMLTKIVLLLNAIFYSALTIGTFAMSLDLLNALEVTALSASAVIEQQVLVGGTFIGMTLFCIIGLVSDKHALTVLGILFVMTLAWLIARGIAITERTPDSEMTYIYLGFEIVMLIILFLTIRVKRRYINSSIFSDDDLIR